MAEDEIEVDNAEHVGVEDKDAGIGVVGVVTNASPAVFAGTNAVSHGESHRLSNYHEDIEREDAPVHFSLPKGTSIPIEYNDEEEENSSVEMNRRDSSTVSHSKEVPLKSSPEQKEVSNDHLGDSISNDGHEANVLNIQAKENIATAPTTISDGIDATATVSDSEEPSDVTLEVATTKTDTEIAEQASDVALEVATTKTDTEIDDKDASTKTDTEIDDKDATTKTDTEIVGQPSDVALEDAATKTDTEIDDKDATTKIETEIVEQPSDVALEDATIKSDTEMDDKPPDVALEDITTESNTEEVYETLSKVALEDATSKSDSEMDDKPSDVALEDASTKANIEDMNETQSNVALEDDATKSDTDMGDRRPDVALEDTTIESNMEEIYEAHSKVALEDDATKSDTKMDEEPSNSLFETSNAKSEDAISTPENKEPEIRRDSLESENARTLSDEETKTKKDNVVLEVENDSTPSSKNENLVTKTVDEERKPSTMEEKVNDDKDNNEKKVKSSEKVNGAENDTEKLKESDEKLNCTENGEKQVTENSEKLNGAEQDKEKVSENGEKPNHTGGDPKRRRSNSYYVGHTWEDTLMQFQLLLRSMFVNSDTWPISEREQRDLADKGFPNERIAKINQLKNADKMKSLSGLSSWISRKTDIGDICLLFVESFSFAAENENEINLLLLLETLMNIISKQKPKEIRDFCVDIDQSMKEIAKLSYSHACSTNHDLAKVSSKLLEFLSPYCHRYLVDLSIASMKEFGYIWGSGSELGRKLDLALHWDFSLSDSESLATTGLWLSQAISLLKRTSDDPRRKEICVSVINMLGKLSHLEYCYVICPDKNSDGKDENNLNVRISQSSIGGVLKSLFELGRRWYLKTKKPFSLDLMKAVISLEKEPVSDSKHESLLALLCDRALSKDTRISGLEHLRAYIKSVPDDLGGESFAKEKENFRTRLKPCCDILFSARPGDIVRDQEAANIIAVIAEISFKDPLYALQNIIMPVLSSKGNGDESRKESHRRFSSAQRAVALGSIASVASYCKKHKFLRDGQSTTNVVHISTALLRKYVTRSNPSIEVAQVLTSFPALCAGTNEFLRRVIECALSYDETLVVAGRQALIRLVEDKDIAKVSKERALELCLQNPCLQLLCVVSPLPEVDHILRCLQTMELVFLTFALHNENAALDLGMCCLLVITHPSKQVRQESKRMLEVLGFESGWNSQLLERACNKIIGTFMNSSLGASSSNIVGMASNSGGAVALELKKRQEKIGVNISLMNNDPLMWWQCQAHMVCSFSSKGLNERKEFFVKALVRDVLYAVEPVSNAAVKAVADLKDCLELVTEELALKDVYNGGEEDDEKVVVHDEQVYSEKTIMLIAALAKHPHMNQSLNLCGREWLRTYTSPSGKVLIAKWTKETFRRVSTVFSQFIVVREEKELSTIDERISMLGFVLFLYKKYKSLESLNCLVELVASGPLSSEKQPQSDKNVISVLKILFRLSEFKGAWSLVQLGMEKLLEHNPSLVDFFYRCALDFGEIQRLKSFLSGSSNDAPDAQVGKMEKTVRKSLVSIPSSPLSVNTSLSQRDLGNKYRCTIALVRALRNCFAKPDWQNAEDFDIHTTTCAILTLINHVDKDIRTEAIELANSANFLRLWPDHYDSSRGNLSVLETNRSPLRNALSFSKNLALFKHMDISIRALFHSADCLSEAMEKSDSLNLLYTLEPWLEVTLPSLTQIEKDDVFSCLFNMTRRLSAQYSLLGNAGNPMVVWRSIAKGHSREIIRYLVDSLSQDLGDDGKVEAFVEVFREVSEYISANNNVNPSHSVSAFRILTEEFLHQTWSFVSKEELYSHLGQEVPGAADIDILSMCSSLKQNKGGTLVNKAAVLFSGRTRIGIDLVTCVDKVWLDSVAMFLHALLTEKSCHGDKNVSNVIKCIIEGSTCSLELDEQNSSWKIVQSSTDDVDSLVEFFFQNIATRNQRFMEALTTISIGYVLYSKDESHREASLKLLKQVGIEGWNRLIGCVRKEMSLRIVDSISASFNKNSLSLLPLLFELCLFILENGGDISIQIMEMIMIEGIHLISLPLVSPDPIECSRELAMKVISYILRYKDFSEEEQMKKRKQFKSVEALTTNILIDSLWVQKLYFDSIFLLHAKLRMEDNQYGFLFPAAFATVVLSLSPSEWFYSNLGKIVDQLEESIAPGESPSELIRIILKRLVSLLKLRKKKKATTTEEVSRKETISSFVQYYVNVFVVPHKSYEAITILVNLLRKGPDYLRTSALQLLVELLRSNEVILCCPLTVLDDVLDVAVEIFATHQSPYAIDIMEILQKDAAEEDQTVAFPFLRSGEESLLEQSEKSKSGQKSFDIALDSASLNLIATLRQ